MKKKTLTYYKKRANASFSKYIRQKYADIDGYTTCYTCNKFAHWKDLQAGHGIAGRNNAVLYMEEVVRPQCVGCNMYGGGKYSIFTEKLIDELGLERYGELVKLANQTVQFKIFNYQEIEEKYENKIKEL